MRVLVVDDSVVFRSQIKEALKDVPQVEVVGTANNGKIALQRLEQSSVDLVTLDMEMPEMGGLETIKEIRRLKFNVKIIVFSSHTTSGSAVALDALAAGAEDFVAKPSGDEINYENAAQKIKGELVPKILQFVRPVQVSTQSSAPVSSANKRTFVKRDLDSFHPSVVVIGSSTGGPPALEEVLKNLSKPIRVPILIAQHMPPIFTASLAARIQGVSGIAAAEARDGEVLEAGKIYVAPGNYHLSIIKPLDKVILKLDQGPQRNSVRPAVDVLFESAATVFGNRVCGVILTGMGEDGMLGAIAIKDRGGGVLIQDRESSVVFGMPGAVYSSGAYDYVGNLASINSYIRRLTT